MKRQLSCCTSLSKFENVVVTKRGRWRKKKKDKELETCSGVHDIGILYMLGHGVEEDTTFSYKEHTHRMHVLCTVSHVGKVPSPSDNSGTDKAETDTEMHVQADQAFS